MTEYWVPIYSIQKEIIYISPSNIRTSAENHHPLSPSIPDILWASPGALPGSAIHVFLVYGHLIQ